MVQSKSERYVSMKFSGWVPSVMLIVLFFVIPLAFIWSLNTLFPVLSIQYGIQTWAAALLFLLVNGRSMTRKGK